MNIYANKLENEEMDKFLEVYDLPKLNYKEIENRYTLITNKEIESVIKNLPTDQSPEPDSFTVTSTKHSRIGVKLSLNVW